MVEKKIKIDLACGANKKIDFLGIDIADIEGVDIVHDLNSYPWPIEDNSVDEVFCSHYVEHIPHENLRGILEKSSSFEEFKEKALETDRDGFIKFMNEVYRILKPKGRALITAPHYASIRAFGDPTHIRYIGDFSFYYFSKEWRKVHDLEHYGIECNFDIKYSYFISNDLALKSEEVQQKAFREDWNSIDDIIVEMIKK